MCLFLFCLYSLFRLEDLLWQPDLKSVSSILLSVSLRGGLCSQSHPVVDADASSVIASPGAMEAAERIARQKEQAEKDKHERMNADLKEVGTSERERERHPQRVQFAGRSGMFWAFALDDLI